MHLSAGPCILRSWQESDLASLVRHANNRKVWLQLRNRLPHPYTEADGRAWIEYAGFEDPMTNFAIEYNNEAVGSIGLILQNDIETGTAEVGYWLGEEVWGKGIGTAALKAFAAWAFAEFDLRRLYAAVMIDNLGSRRVLEKAGFVLEGILRQHALKDGVLKDQAYYGLLRNELRQ
ncbi:MAG TPA: GNAT family protein [Gemmatales bacterium]|nr:GNAT family protein [Gemmatales bacterium]